MNAETGKIDQSGISSSQAVASDTPCHPLLAQSFGGLKGLADRIRTVEEAVDVIGEASDQGNQASVGKLKRQLHDFEPTVTMIGQVKAGKTSLVNALIGRPGLLPADINPWTSVVTSLHLDAAAHGAEGKSRFRFFDEEEWDRLLTRGGRVGELAARAGADRELEKVRAQLSEMREKSRKRLGRKFELLMGQEHEYGYVDEELIQRYVCLGDEMDDDISAASMQQGRFADITKSADLYLRHEALPHRLCIRDTPGVNDTFMIREQITVNAIRDSRLCVVVLSAHQTLSTVDMALIRMISNVNSRDVIIFVNRIDELGDAVTDAAEIRESVVNTLKALDGPTDAEIIFGSAHWANHALTGEVDQLGHASAEALVSWAEAFIDDLPETPSVEETIWQLSGIPRLCKAISDRVVQGEGAEFVDRVARSARNAANGLATAQQVVRHRANGGAVAPIQRKDIGREIDRIVSKNRKALDEGLDDLIIDLDARLNSSRRSFLGRATASLVNHLDAYGDKEVWTYDPAGLRLLLRSGYRVFGTKAGRTGDDILLQLANDFRELYIAAFRIPDGSFAIEAPKMPKAPPPVILGSSIALDIRGNWWTNWWRRRRSYQSFAGEFAELIDAEIEPLVGSLRAEYGEPYVETIKSAVDEFIEMQRANLVDLAQKTEIGVEDLRETIGQLGQQRWDTLKTALTKLSEVDQANERKVA